LITTCVIKLLDEPVKSVLPLYTAVMGSDPVARDEVVKVATPLESSLDPSSVVPFIKFTLPVGVPIEELTVAVNVTGLCNRAGLTLVPKVAVVLARFTVSWTV
jgi:hypothetical protein